MINIQPELVLVMATSINNIAYICMQDSYLI